jgi:NarL family two-component system response regulator LiaR
MMSQIRVLIVDDHAVVRKGIQMFLSTEPSIQAVGEAEDGQDAVRKAKSLQPDVVLMDLVMPKGDGIEAIAKIKRCVSNVKIIVLTTFKDGARINAALQAGADGYLLKDADVDALLQAIHAVQQGDAPLDPCVARHLVSNVTQHKGADGIKHLTEREEEVLRLVAKGLSNKAVARALNLSEGTTRIHVSNILGKLNALSRTEAAVRAVQMGLISLGQNSG